MDDLVEEMRREIETLKERVRQLEAALVPPTDIPVEWGLPNCEARLFAHLASRPVASKESCFHALYSDRVHEQPALQTVESHMSKLRRKIRRHGFDISGERFVGYRLIRPDDHAHESEAA